MAWQIELFDEGADLGGREAESSYAVALDDQQDALAALRKSDADGVFVSMRRLTDAEAASLDLGPGEVRRV